MQDDPLRRTGTVGPIETKPVGGETLHIRSDQLLRGAREIVIDHAGRQYLLRITQNGKLILTA